MRVVSRIWLDGLQEPSNAISLSLSAGPSCSMLATVVALQ
jgi:hypothetical protein